MLQKNMSRVLLLTLYLSVTSSAIMKVDLTFGLKGGVNLSGWHSGDDYLYLDSNNIETDLQPYEFRTLKVGPNIGLQAGIRFFGWLELQPEIAYSLKGMRVKNDLLEIAHTELVQLHYIDIPLLLKLNVDGFASTIAFYAGPQVSFLIKNNGYVKKTPPSGTPRTHDYDEELNSAWEESLNKQDFSFCIGISPAIGNKPLKFLLDVRYTHGLLEIHETMEPFQDYSDPDFTRHIPKGTILNKPTHKNFAISVRIGLVYEVYL